MGKSVLNELLKEYEKTRINNEIKLLNRKSNLYKQYPRLQEIEDEIASVSISVSKEIIQNNNPKILASLKKKITALSNEKKNVLKSLGKTQNYLKPIYICEDCKDTGYFFDKNMSIMCNCLKQKLFDIEYNKSNLNNLDKENFSKFNLEIYSNEINKEKYGSEISPRQNMKDLKECAEQFIQDFDDPDKKNLIFSGGTGLGKTFLSNCIVNELMKKGKTVLYQTAPVMLDNIMEAIFSKDEAKKAFSESLLTVELLIIDDLGTETMNSMKFTEMYKIINTRLLNNYGKITKTIISTNLDLQDLFRTYDERLVSRFVGYYDVYHFFGDDIRFKIRNI